VSTHPIAQLLSARLALVEAGIDGSSVWFYGDKAPESEAVIREWAAANSNAVTVFASEEQLAVDHRNGSIVTWYPSYAEITRKAAPSTDDDAMWSPAHGGHQ